MTSSRSINVHLRLKPREVRMWRAFAKRSDESLSEWIRNRCKVPSASDTEALALRTGIETVIRAFGTKAAEWTQQLSGLLVGQSAPLQSYTVSPAVLPSIDILSTLARKLK